MRAFTVIKNSECALPDKEFSKTKAARMKIQWGDMVSAWRRSPGSAGASRGVGHERTNAAHTCFHGEDGRLRRRDAPTKDRRCSEHSTGARKGRFWRMRAVPKRQTIFDPSPPNFPTPNKCRAIIILGILRRDCARKHIPSVSGEIKLYCSV